MNFTNKNIIFFGMAVLVIGAAGFYLVKNGRQKETTLVVHPSDFVQQVSVSGKVIATENLDLSFEQSGRITDIKVKVGDKVFVGQSLASQDTAQLNAQLAEMQAGIDVQKAKLNQLLAGASAEDISLSETAVINARTSLQGAKQNIIDKLKDAYTKSDDAVTSKADQIINNPQSSNPSVLGYLSVESQLKSDTEWQRLLLENMFSLWQASLNKLTLFSDSDFNVYINTAKNNLSQVISFLDKAALIVNNASVNSSLTQATIDKWKTDISTGRTNVNTAVANLTAAEEKLKTAEAELRTAQDQLTLKKAPAREFDVALIDAQIKQAQASAQNILVQLDKMRINSPINGIVAAVNAKVGSVAAANDIAISIISTDTLQIESYIPEKNIPFVKVGDEAVIILDAYGSDVPFVAKVISIDPAETIRDGVSTYRTKMQFIDHNDDIKSGMTAGIIITTEKKSNIIAIPQGVVVVKDGQKFVQVKKGGIITYRKIETGSVSSLGQIEVISGLSDGDVVVLKQAAK